MVLLNYPFNLGFKIKWGFLSLIIFIDRKCNYVNDVTINILSMLFSMCAQNLPAAEGERRSQAVKSVAPLRFV